MDLKPQLPAQGIMQTHDSPMFKMYRVECNCGTADDAIEFTVDGSYGEIVVQTYTTQKTAWWEDPFKKNESFQIENEFLYQLNYYVRGFLNAIAHRLRITWDVWVHGHVKYSQSTIMTPQQAVNYAHTLIEAVEDVQKNSKQQS